MNDAEEIMCEVHVSRQRLVLPSRRRGPSLGRKVLTSFVHRCKRLRDSVWYEGPYVHAKADVVAEAEPVGAKKAGRYTVTMNQKRRQNTRKKLRKRDGDDCFYCGIHMPAGDRTIEHVLAKKHGGNDKMANLVLAHSECNQRADDMSIAAKITLREVLHLL